MVTTSLIVRFPAPLMVKVCDVLLALSKAVKVAPEKVMLLPLPMVRVLVSLLEKLPPLNVRSFAPPTAFAPPMVRPVVDVTVNELATLFAPVNAVDDEMEAVPLMLTALVVNAALFPRIRFPLVIESVPPTPPASPTFRVPELKSTPLVRLPEPVILTVPFVISVEGAVG